MTEDGLDVLRGEQNNVLVAVVVVAVVIPIWMRGLVPS
jgi:hypothetical protein